MMTKEPTLGQVIAERRARLQLSLKDLGRLVRKESGEGVSAQYLHDIERDRRTPSPHVLGELARALGVDVHYLAAVAGQCPPEVTTYLRERPEAGPAIAAFFARARATGFTDWETLSRALGNGQAAGTTTEAAAAGR
jgi:transcriptional regulator with XRE-family HTH domain